MYCLTETSMAGGAQFDPFNQARLPAPPLEGKAEERLVVDSMLSTCVIFKFIILTHQLGATLVGASDDGGPRGIQA